MEERTLGELRANPKNPRTISNHDFDHLKQSIKEFGDLSGIVLNVQTNQLVGGHQRIEAFKALGATDNIEVVKRFDVPTTAGTVAVGFVNLGVERYPYREVNWPLERELAANIAANRITGEFDKDLLAEVTYEISQMNPDLLDLTGQTQAEVNKLLAQIGVVEDPATENQEDDEAENELVFAVTQEQGEQIARALEHSKLFNEIPNSEIKRQNGTALYYIIQHYLNTMPRPELLDNDGSGRLDQI